MGLLFERYASVTIGPPGIKTGKKISGLRLKFKVEKSGSADPNTLDLEIYNPAPSTVALAKARDSVVILSAGYVDMDEVLFQGEINHAAAGKKKGNGESADAGARAPLNISRSGTDRIIKIECGDGAKAIQNATFSKSYEAGTPAMKVLQDLQGSMATEGQVGLGDILLNPKAMMETFVNGFSFNGFSKDALDKLMPKLGDAEWSVQDGMFQAVDPKLVTLGGAVLVTPKSGLLDSPRKTEKGVEFRTLLNPKLKPGRLVSMLSEEVQGFYKVLKVTHTGDTHGDEWFSDVEAKQVSV